MKATHFLPFARPQVDGATIGAVADVLASGWITSGPKVLEFEARLSDFFGGRPVRAFANGTASMEVALRLADVGPGDEVISTPLTWVATANVIVAVGARPIFVDVDPRTRNIDLEAAAAAITPRTKALMPVFLGGLPVDMDRLYELARQNGLRVVEDAAQAIDSRWDGRPIGAFGDLVSFSFQANKNITCAEGGCLVVNNNDEAERAGRLRLQGVVRSGTDGMDIEEPGGKFNLTDINAVIGLHQLKGLAAVTRRRAELAEAYFAASGRAGLESLGIELPLPLSKARAMTNWHMFQVVVPSAQLRGGRPAVMDGLRALGIGTGVHYPAIHTFTFYRSQGWREGMLPRAERIGRGILTLPLYPSLQEEDVERICAALGQVCRGLLQ